MKKNKTMRIASVLLIAVLLTTSVISGTFAKYVTTGEVNDSARVAKFGVVIAGSGSLFDKTYYRVGKGNTPAGGDEEGPAGTKLTVESSNSDNVVAPGTKSDENSPFTIKVTGAPEVDVKITLSLDGSKDIYLAPAGNTYPDRTTQAAGDRFNFEETYYPIVYTLKLDGQKLVSGTIEDVKTYLEDYEMYVDAISDTASSINHAFTLSWEWEFTDEDAATVATTEFEENIANDSREEGNRRFEYNGVTYYEVASNTQAGKDDYIAARSADLQKLRDQQDTLLGDLAANAVSVRDSNGDYNLNVNIALSVTVTQVD